MDVVLLIVLAFVLTAVLFNPQKFGLRKTGGDMAGDLMKERTGLSIRSWINKVQKLIALNTVTPKGATHGITNKVWILELLVKVKKTMPKKGEYDGNMWLASTIGAILIGWYLRVHRAKAYDPQRPVAHRRKALRQRMEFAQFINSLIIDESEDYLIFNQEWDVPFSKHAKDGKFV